MIVKNLNFGVNAKEQVFKGIEKLTNAVSSTLGASGKCVILEDANGKPIITKDGVTVADSIILLDPVENIGATLLKEAAKKTVKEAGDGTTTATVLAYSILKEAYSKLDKTNVREIKNGILNGVDKVIKYITEQAVPVKDKIQQIATISTNNDKELGDLIAQAFIEVGNTGVVMMEPSSAGETKVEIVEGVEYNKGLLNQNFITNKDNTTAELENPLVMIVDSKIDSIRQIQNVLEYVIKNNKALFIIGQVEPAVLSALVMNKIKGNIKVNVVDPPAFGLRRKQILEDLALLTNSQIINEDLGDDLNTIELDYLGTCLKTTTGNDQTIIQIEEVSDEVNKLIKKVKKDLTKKLKPHEVIGLEQRLARLSAKVAIVKVGANSDIELKEKQDRIEDAICATKAAIKEGVVAGGGVALLNASKALDQKNIGENILYKAIKAPYDIILANAGIENKTPIIRDNYGLNVVTGNMVHMVKEGIIDPLLVTKSALTNAASVATTILSTDCVINNVRTNESSR
ncbi:molecular chaperone GroEL [Candidatus Woesearchaeota archaeon]|nr:molecular chaperone GroEL [Candidatus Woesearchaeota archaeon]|tara:strand:- start:12512 stop:14056 length:1545 start_codon:yes stop_codon:yes gene_type:complete